MPRQARVAIRHIRRDGMDVLKKLEKDGDHEPGRRPRARPTWCRRRPTPRSARSIRSLPLRNRKSCRSRLHANCGPEGRRCPVIPPSSSTPRAAGPAHSGAYRRDHGRQWPLGQGARQAAAPRAMSTGVKALRRLVELCITYGVGHLTVFSFSSENWTRPQGRNQLHLRSAAPVCCVRSRKAASATMCGCGSSARARGSTIACAG